MEKTTLHLRKDDREYLRKEQEKKDLPIADALHEVLLEHHKLMKMCLRIRQIVKNE